MGRWRMGAHGRADPIRTMLARLWALASAPIRLLASVPILFRWRCEEWRMAVDRMAHV
jgi:hypothetical protein